MRADSHAHLQRSRVDITLGIHEFDRAKENAYIGLAQELMVNRLIIKVRVKRTSSGFITYTDMQHHVISADLLARKWVIGLDKANSNLK